MSVIYVSYLCHMSLLLEYSCYMCHLNEYYLCVMSVLCVHVNSVSFKCQTSIIRVYCALLLLRVSGSVK
jgi:hypothetical protein